MYLAALVSNGITVLIIIVYPLTRQASMAVIYVTRTVPHFAATAAPPPLTAQRASITIRCRASQSTSVFSTVHLLNMKRPRATHHIVQIVREGQDLIAINAMTHLKQIIFALYA